MDCLYSKSYFKSVLIAVAIGSFSFTFGQSSASDFFIKHGNNLSQVSCAGVLFAPIQNQNHQAWGAGSVWLRKQIDLRQPLDVSFIVDFIDTTANDGGAFVLQPDSTAVGDTYYGLGFRNIKHSVAVTFDLQRTNYDNDPAFDHIGIQANGDTKHGSVNELTIPVSLESYYSYHYFPPPALPTWSFHRLVTVKWDPLSQILSTYFDNALVISTRYDIIQKIFNGNPIVYWGFTASNTQEIWYPAPKELTFGYFNFFLGEIYPRYTTNPELDTCFSKPIQFFDASVYAADSAYNILKFVKWYWDFGDGQTSSDRNPPPHQYSEPGEYQLRYAVSNGMGCTFDTLVRKIRLGSMPTVDFSIDGPSCNNSPVFFKDRTVSSIGPPSVWYWNFDNTSTSMESNPIASFPDPGFKTVTLRVRTFYGCESEKTKIIEVGQKPMVDYSTTQDCDGNVHFIPTVTNGTAVTQWHWFFGDQGFSINQIPTHHYNNNGIYTSLMFAISNTGCISDSSAKNILINKIYPFAGNDTILSVAEKLQLNATGGEFYHWTPSTGLSNADIANPVVSLSNDQSYFLTIRNSNGCEAMDTLRIKVYVGPDVYLPNAFSPNADGHNDQFKLIAPGIKTLEYLRIFDRKGNLLYETKQIIKGWDGTFKGRAQPEGSYVWLLSAIDYTGKKIFKKGIVVLVR